MRVGSYAPEQRVYLPALRAGWLTQTFVHWASSPEQVQRLLPEGLTVDTCEQWAWVSLTPFVMAGVRLPGVPAALPSFAETDLRTYVRERGGGDGLCFLTPEVSSPVMLAARAIGAPYHLGHLMLSRRGDAVTYAGARGVAGRRTAWWSVRTSRSGRAGGTCGWRRGGGPSHGAATCSGRRPSSTSPGRWRGAPGRPRGDPHPGGRLPRPAQEPLVHFSDGVHKVRFGVSRPVRPTGRRPG
ncbi:DUF2071 domain-containing protein [Streptomyces sp. NPDC046727]|uniref:DUF2071 domain-containing protein n=1 Tax=Streptomyces sp. NPDC046727 TaxID=3155373 RepID=UPI0033C81FB0